MSYLCCKFQRSFWPPVSGNPEPQKSSLRKIKQISWALTLSAIRLTALFWVVKAGAQQEFIQKIKLNMADTTLQDTVGFHDSLANDPKKGFQDLFRTAVIGDGSSPARLNPMAVTFVNNYIARNGKGFNAMKGWAKPYFNMMDEVLTQHGLPRELKYIAVIESGLKYNVISWSGAVGPWALMPAAARQYGLHIGRPNDERLDYYKSTHAAAKLLTDLYQRYGDWLLVVAAYNSGPGNVDKAIRRSGSKDFWTLQYYLPAETMNHVKKFIATHYIFEGEGGITTSTKKETKDQFLEVLSDLNDEEKNNSSTYTIKGRFSSDVIMKYTGMDMASFRRYNPNFDQQVSVNGQYELRLPAEKMNIFVAKRYEILDESMKAILPSSGTR